MTEPKWGVKTPPHIQDKCDFTLIYWWVVKHDIPLEVNMYSVHRGHSFPVGNKLLHTLKGGYIVGTLKFSGTLFQGRGLLHLEKGSLKAYLLKYTVICRLARLGGLCGGHCQLPLW